MKCSRCHLVLVIIGSQSLNSENSCTWVPCLNNTSGVSTSAENVTTAPGFTTNTHKALMQS